MPSGIVARVNTNVKNGPASSSYLRPSGVWVHVQDTSSLHLRNEKNTHCIVTAVNIQAIMLLSTACRFVSHSLSLWKFTQVSLQSAELEKFEV